MAKERTPAAEADALAKYATSMVASDLTDKERFDAMVEKFRGLMNGDAASTTLLILPIAEVPETTWGLHVDTRLTPKQSRALRRIAMGLDAQQARLESGVRVVSNNDAIKFLLEQVVAEASG